VFLVFAQVSIGRTAALGGVLPWLTMGFFSYLLVLTIVRDVSLIGSLALSAQAHES